MPSVAAMEGISVLQEGSPNRTRRESLKILNRNISQVVLGNLLFEAWYYSPYPDQVILPSNLLLTARQPGSAAELRNGHALGLTKDEPVCRRLYVCPCCFRYTPDERDYMQHLQYHRNLREQGLETQPVPESAFKVYEWDGYAVWEIDGEKEKLYCQNLSLFGKLFLEQKSVFFDTGGFKYYALTHTPSSPPEPMTAAKGRGRKRSSSAMEEDSFYDSRVLGFFSKENLSWDSNNLACILIFPPFQHRQLGQLLMAVSYKLSGWEWEGGVIGGPEKPLSAMGRKSYLRFWSERIARFMMGQTADADAKKVFHNARKKTVHPKKEEMTIKEIGDRTGMLAEDVAAALAEMGICKVVIPKRKKKPSNEVNGAGVHSDGDIDELATMVVQRSTVVEWANQNRVDLVSPVREEGFLGEWALSEEEEEDSSNAGVGSSEGNGST